MTEESGQKLTRAFTDAVAEAEELIANAPHVRTEQDLVEGYEYLAGNIRAAIQLAWAHDRDFPRFAVPTGPFTKMGLDNPDTLYYSATIRDDAEYVVTGRRGSTVDLSFQVMGGNYTPEGVPASLAAFDDREIEIASDGTFELRFGPPGNGSGPNYVPLGEGTSILAVREVYSDWETERCGTIRIHRTDTAGTAPPAPTRQATARRYEAAGKMLLGRLRTFLKFPEWFYLDLPVNTMTEPRVTPGGLTSQYSAVGHYELDEDQAMIVEVPRSEAPYQGFQLGSRWYVSMEYANAQTSLTSNQARIDPDGLMRFVISERDPGVANWLACTGHRRGYAQIRWQRLARELTAADGPRVEVVAFDELPKRLSYHEESRVSPAEHRDAIARRQAAVADRMVD